MSTTTVPAVEGWFAEQPDGAAALIGSQCAQCQAYFFPKESAFCRNPSCSSSDLAEVPLSQRGQLWSWTTNCYAPPHPYVASDPFEPYTVAAVELAHEKMVVLGQMARDVAPDELEAGTQVELVVGTLYADDETEYLMWNWKPVAA